MSPVRDALLLLFIGGLAAGLAFTPVARRLGRRLGLVDRPDGRRKVHERTTPVAGGLAVFAAVILVLGVFGVAGRGPVAEEVREHAWELLGLLGGAAVICLVGVADDGYRLRGRYKLCGQVAAIGVVLLTGSRIEVLAIFGREFDLGWAAIPFTTLFLLGAINSLNLLDGMDGLLGTVGTIICGAIAVLAVYAGHPAEACVAAGLAGALAGFLRYNMPPASVFLGDAGSMLIGLAVGVLAIRSSLKGPATAALAAPLALLAIPFFDTAAAVVRRKLTGRSIFSTDRGHIHHCLQRTGLSGPAVLLVVGGLCAVTVAGVLASIAFQNEGLAVLSALVVVVILVATKVFGYAELRLVMHSGRHLARSVLGSDRDNARLEVRLHGSAGWDGLWVRLTDCVDRLNLRSIALDVNAPAQQEVYHARWRRPGPATSEALEDWSAVIPLTAWGHAVGQVIVIGRPDAEPVWRKLAVLTGVTDDVEAVLARSAPIPTLAGPTAVPESLVGAGSA
ncbi:MAG TPA: MraY family glycosyltransferase [Gemmataceae bacterium]|nr:MraY family glycosyltransferase [Gemmataceae bacterium]